MKKMILNIAMTATSFLFFHTAANAQKNTDTVYYFIDTDLKSSITTGAEDFKGIYASTLIGTALWQNRGTLITQFKVKLKEKFPNQPDIDARIVFRWQPSMKDIKDSYVLKEIKMKNGNYSIANIE